MPIIKYSSDAEPPIRVIILAFAAMAIAITNGLRLGEAIFFWNTLLEYGSHPLYIAFSGGVWFMAWVFLVWNLWQGKVLAWIGSIVAATAYGAWYWIDRLILQRPHANWPFALVTTAIFLLIVYSFLFSYRTRQYFMRRP